MSEDAVEGGEQAHKGPLHRTLDICVFAPVGLAVTVVEDLPELIAKGRRRVGLELGNARVVGRFVVHKGQHRVSGRLEDLLRNGDEPGVENEVGEAGVEEAAPRAEQTGAHKPARDSAAAAVVSGVLADYDTLSASQVVRRLEGLGPEELQAVLRYEGSHRNRRTILHRATQLLDEAHGGTGAAAKAEPAAPRLGPDPEPDDTSDVAPPPDSAADLGTTAEPGTQAE